MYKCAFIFKTSTTKYEDIKNIKKKKIEKKIILKHLHLSVSLPVIERRIEFVLYNLLNLMTYN